VNLAGAHNSAALLLGECFIQLTLLVTLGNVVAHPVYSLLNDAFNLPVDFFTVAGFNN
jgi:hypothetical protein